jgi:hypothetical protein
MATIIAIFTTAVVLLGLVHPAIGHAQGRSGGVRDIVKDIFGAKRDLRGHVVQHREATLILSADDGHIYTINTAALDTAAMGRLAQGRPVAVALKSEVPTVSTMPIAEAIRPMAGPIKVFRRVEGTVETVTVDRVIFKTRDGLTVALDRSKIVGEAPTLTASEEATLIYEEQPRLAGLWIDPHDGAQPSASVGTPPSR